MSPVTQQMDREVVNATPGWRCSSIVAREGFSVGAKSPHVPADVTEMWEFSEPAQIYGVGCVPNTVMDDSSRKDPAGLGLAEDSINAICK
ncbi:MAG: hypothetical protein IIB16_04785 [Chloroflexi bacterium]|nr:hypothetical protein [Chloroflexota bacterium]